MRSHDYLFLLGAPKSGTTSVAHWLGELEGSVLARRKETLYFTDYACRTWTGPGAGYASGAPRSIDEFFDQFSDKPDARLRIEASTDTLSHRDSCKRLLAFRDRPDVGSVRIVAILRDPIERIVSEFEHTLKYGWQKPDLLASLQQEDARRRAGWHPLFYHVFRSRYAEQLGVFQEAFGPDLRIVDYKALADPGAMDELAQFAGRPQRAVPIQIPSRNAREVYARPRLQRFVCNETARRIARAVIPQPMRDCVRSRLRGPSVDRIEPNAAEITFIMSRLRADIQACVDSPEIPTDSWTCPAYL